MDLLFHLICGFLKLANAPKLSNYLRSIFALVLGIIRRQSLISSILFYAGAAIGFLNKALLFTNFLSVEQVGLSNILVTNAMLYSQISALGFNTMTLRFFPFFHDKRRGHHGFLFWLLAIPTFGFVVMSVVVVLFRDNIFDYFRDESPLMIEYFWCLIPLGLSFLYFDLFDSYLRSLLKTSVPILFREVIQRIFVGVAVLLYAIGWVDFHQFVWIYVGLLCSVTLLIAIYTLWLGHLNLNPRPGWRVRQLYRKALVFGGYTLLGNLSGIVLYNLDGLMLASYMGMDAVGIYTTSFYLSALIIIPWRALQKIASPELTLHWKNRDMVAIDRLYKRTSLINVGVGGYMMVGMVLAIPLMYELMPKDFSAGIMVLIIIGLSRVLDMLTGLNTYILIMSKEFRVELLLSLVVLVVGISLNFIMIPLWGIEGASLATGLAITLSNLLRSFYLWFKFRLNPLTSKMWWVTGFLTLATLAVYFIPAFHPLILSFVLRAGLFTVIFVGLLLRSHAIPDLNKFYELILQKVSSRLQKTGKA